MMNKNRLHIKLLIKLIVFSVREGKLQLSLQKGNLPSEELPPEKTTDETVKEIFYKETHFNLKGNYLEQLYTFSGRAQEGSNIEIVYYALVPAYRIQEDDLGNWTNWSDLKKDRKDNSIVSYAVQRLQWKIEYTNVVYSMLPDEFTLSELQTVYEAILGRYLDKRNFRKKITSLKLLQNTHKKRKGTVARPAEIYKFKTRKPQIVKVF